MANEDKLRDYLKRVTTDLHQTRERLRELEENRQEPMAIVGMACSFPGGAGSPGEFWDLLISGRDAVGSFPADRGWAADVYDPDPETPGKTYSDQGGFLYDAGDFDAGFFGVSPREALAMDPQQRLLLETSWHALEDAGIAPDTLRGSATGVFAGLIYHDYLNLGDVSEEVAGYLGTGGSGGVASGRVAYALGLEGPAVTIDTACSSSLVAVHLACQSLRSGESDLALAGGVTIMSTPSTFIDFSRQRGLAADGRCKAYADSADGTGWGEGVGVLVLERLSDAKRHGHRILGVVAGTAMNQDGASNGLTAPSGLAQQRVIRAALAGAGIGPGGVDVVEGHGTGTRLGDPIEAQALLATYGQERDRPLLLGSVKSNIGHTQAAAGVAGIIKMVAAMRHGIVPATLHVDRPSSHVDWDAGKISLTTENTPWPRTDHPRRAGISSFGFSGTNAHVIVEQAPIVEEPVVPAGPGIVPWVLSGRTPEALSAQARALAELAPEDLAGTAFSLATTRSALEHRAVVLGDGTDELLAGLRAVAERREVPTVVTSAAPAGPGGKIGFVFTGQGAQRIGMGRRLYAAHPVFAAAFDAVCAGFAGHLDGSLADVIAGESGDLNQTMWTQAALFALEVALYRLLESWHLTPAAVAGHSIGELAAAHVAGVWSLDDACAVVAARGRLMQALPEGGAMIAVEAGEEQVLAALAGRPGAGIAAVNGPQAVVVSGVQEDVEAVAATFARTRRLQVSHAFHSPLMEPMLAEFGRVLAGVTFHEPTLTLISARTGGPVTTEVTEPGYWVEHVREAVRFADAVDGLRAADVHTFLEIGPDGVLTGLGSRIPAGGPAELGTAELWTPALRRGRDEVRTLLTALARLHVRGHLVDWPALLPAARRVDLPAYPFQRDHYWLARTAPADAAGLGQIATHHPLLGATIDLPANGVHLLTGQLDPAAQPWLADHRVADRIVLPGAALIDMAIRAGDQTGCSRVEEMLIEAPLVLRGPVRVQVVVEGPDDAGRRAFGIYAQDAADPEWIRHATGVLTVAATAPSTPTETWPPVGVEPADLTDFYPSLASAGLGYGPVFRGVRAAWRRGAEIFAEVELPDGLAVAGYGLHPALLDAALQVAGLDDRDGLKLPFAWSDVTVHATGAVRARVRIAPAASGEGVAVTLTDPAGSPIATAGSLVLRAADPAALAVDPAADALHRVEWIPAPPAATPDAGTWSFVDTGEALPTGPAPDVIVLRAVPEPAADVAEAARDLTLTVLATVQQWLAAENLAGTRLLVVTRRAVDAGPESATDPAAAPIWGLAGTLQSENPGRVLLADADDPDDPALEDTLRAAATLDEPRFAIRSGQVRVPRLTRAATGLPVPADGWRLGFHERGTLDRLTLLAPDATRPLGDGEVRVEIRAAGVNFRDVLNVLGMYPGDAGQLGLEGAGVVTEVGAGVTGLRPGDRVMGLFTGAFTGTAVTDARLVAPIPAGWSMAQAAAAPVVYLTAWYALVELAALTEGESILVHAAAGGVGTAAVQLARHLGARVLATASPGKWAAVRDLGVEASHLASSRTTGFEAAFRAVTDGRGVDVVLDSLAGEFVDASLRLTRPGGRFIEMGKTDIRDAAEVERAHRIAYRAFDLLEQPPDAIAAMLAELLPLFASGALRPLPVAAWDVREAVDAFRFVSQARHIGKVVLTAPPAPFAESTVLITGASGALGGVVARHVRASAQVLLSRRGPEASGTASLASDIAQAGGSVRVVACDVADEASLAAVLAGERITDVVHAAGVLDDGLLGSLTPQRVAGVLRAKVDAAWTLHRLTAGLDLRSFVLFSSIAGVAGNVGQANYAAANTFLDALAVSRRRAGLPAVSIAWGPWAAGMADTLGEADRQRMARQGLRPLPSADALALLDAIPAAVGSHLVAARLDLPALRRSGHVPPLMSGLVRRDGPNRRTAGRVDAAAGNALAALGPAERREAVQDIVLEQAALVLGMSGPAGIDAGRTFRDVGFDSLTAVELRNRLNTTTGVRLPATAVFDHPTPAALAAFVASELGGDARIETVRTGAVPADSDKLVIVGMGCSFPGGVTSPAEFWQMLAEGRDAVGSFPADRGWALDVYDPDPEAPGKSYTDQGAFLERAGEFDAHFFGISPREALSMDPQQRLLLETSWHALEDAGIDPATLRGSATGVFSGLIYHDYMPYGAPPQDAEGYLGTGGSGGVASGRVAYALGLEGPAVTIDTACSSSLVAVHLACQSLRSGESDLALAGGATVMATPGTFIDFSRQRGLAADGRCKAYADGADGTGWGEGVGVLVLERLSDAQRNGHRILGIVAGTAMNQDGASNGLTAPNGLAQQRVIRTALAGAGLTPDGVDVVEGHGTGTRLGDPIEAQALLATYGQERDRPLWLGSVKSNIGHTQAAAGVAGIIKMVAAMRHGVIPATLHVDRPSSHVDWASGNIRLATENTPWPQTDHPRRAGISSFGFSGTNAHVIVEQAPVVEEPVAAAGPRIVPWVLSGRTPEALAAQGRALAKAAPEDLAGTAFSLATMRSALEHRAVVVGENRDELLAGLAALIDGRPAATLVSGAGGVTGVSGALGKTGFVFTGQGAQRIGMGRQLHEAFPVFADAFDAACAGLAEHLDGSLRDVIAGESGDLNQTMWTQAGLFALEVALYRLLESWGITAPVVAGHSIGELAAAHVAGVWSLADACAVVAARGRLMQELPAGGAMVAVEAGEEQVLAALAGRPGVGIAAVNGPQAVVVSGVEAEVEAVAATFARTRKLQVSHAFHSPLMEPMLERFAAVVRSVSARRPSLTLISARTGRPITDEVTDPGYWVEHVREAVRFTDAVDGMRELGVRAFVEIGPDGILSGMGPQTRTGSGEAELWQPALRRGRDEVRTLLTAVAKLHVRGRNVDWAAILPPARRVELPGYAFQREHYWLTSGAAVTDATGLGQAPADHPLLGAAVELPATGEVVLTGRLTVQLTGAAAGDRILPGSALLDMVIRAGDETGCPRVEELVVDVPIVLPVQGGLQVRIQVGAPEAGRREAGVFTRAAEQPWTRHATAVLTATPHQAATPYQAAASYQAGAEPDTADWAAQWPPADVVTDGATYTEVELPERTDATGYGLHPLLLEAALRAVPGPAGAVPLHWNDVTVRATGATAARVRITANPAGDGAAIDLADLAGGLIARVGSVVLAELPPGTLDRAAGSRHDALFGLDWLPVEAPAASGGRWAVLGDDGGLAIPGASRHADLPSLIAAGAPDVLAVAVPATGDGAVYRVLDVLQAWLAAEDLSGTRLVVVTERAVDAGPEAEVCPAVAGVTGLVRSAANEHPDRLVLADADTLAGAGALVVSGVALDGPEFAIRAGQLRVPRLSPITGTPESGSVAPDSVAPGSAADGVPPRGEPGRSGAVLITGASGALGGLVARHLATRELATRDLATRDLAAAGTAAEQILVSRRGPQAPGTATLAAELAETGRTVRIRACDVSDPDQLAAVLAGVPLTDVVHAAGVLDDGVLTALTPDRLAGVLRAKADAAWNLHRVTAGLDLRSFVLFSSIAGVIGNVGQASYAAANTSLDALAASRRRAGLPAVSIAWGPWAAGMAGELTEADRQRMARQGLRPLPSADALALLDAALDRPEPLLVAALLDRRALRRPGNPVPAVLTGLVRPGRPTAGRRTATAARNLVNRLVMLPAQERQREILTLVRTEAALVLGLPGPNAIDAGRYFRQLGFDSLTALEFRNRIGEAVGVRLPVALVFDYPTPAGLADFLGTKVADREIDDRPVLDQLDKLASLLPAIAQHHGKRSKILARLEALADGLRAGDASGETSDEDIAAATDDEIFDLIDKELGI